MNLSTAKAFKRIKNNDNLFSLSEEDFTLLHKSLSEMLKDFDEVCKKYDIKYFLCGGSMLGAIRNNHIIPWDDDIDIFVTREDYERFNDIFKTELASKYWNQIPGITKDFSVMAGKLRKKGTIFLAREDASEEEAGIWIDIFILENTYDNAVLRFVHGFLCMASGFLLSCRSFSCQKDILLSIADGDKHLTRIFKTKIFIGKLLSFLSVDKWASFTNKVYSMCKNKNSLYVVCPGGVKHFTGELYKRNPFCERKQIEFENIQTYISADYDGYLKNLYGDDYMIPHNEDEREIHVVRKFKI